jgi:hypothetical protein
LLPEDVEPLGWNRIDGTPLSEKNLDEFLQAVPSDTATRFEDDNLFRISIAGAQEKTALLHWKGKWYLPHGATPTTHIHYLFHTIEARHWHALAMKNGGPGVWKAMLGLAGRVEAEMLR